MAMKRKENETLDEFAQRCYNWEYSYQQCNLEVPVNFILLHDIAVFKGFNKAKKNPNMTNEELKDFIEEKERILIDKEKEIGATLPLWDHLPDELIPGKPTMLRLKLMSVNEIIHQYEKHRSDLIDIFLFDYEGDLERYKQDNPDPEIITSYTASIDALRAFLAEVDQGLMEWENRKKDYENRLAVIDGIDAEELELRRKWRRKEAKKERPNRGHLNNNQ